MSKNKGGRPTKMTPEVIGKLEAAFINAFSDKEACLYAGIDPDTLYQYQLKHPKFAERKEQLKLSPNLVARKTVVDNLKDPNHAWKWLERKDPDMKPSSKIEHAGKLQLEPADLPPDVQEAIKAYEEKRKQQIQENRNKMP